MFERKFSEIEYEGDSFQVWTNPPRGLLTEKGKTNGPFLGLVLVKWSLGGQIYEEYEFPETPSEEAANHLPLDYQEGLALAVGEAIRNAVPKPKKRR